MATQDDPWSALQKPGSEAMDAQQARIAPAYATSDDRGNSVVGFDLAMSLPAVCVKCGSSSDTSVLMPIKIEIDLSTTVLMAPDGAELDGKLGPGKFPLRLPYCNQCVHRRQQAIKLRQAKMVSPVVLVVALVAAAAIHQSLIGVVLLASLIIGPALWFASMRWWSASMVEIDRLDSDGFIRLIGVHPDAGEAIVAASLAKPPA